MSEAMRKRLRDGYRETLGGVSRATATLGITCLSIVILTGVDDTEILGHETVSTPFIGPARYELFIVLAPALITTIRLYVDLQVSYMVRLSAIVQRYNIRSSLALTATNTPILWFAGACAIHLAPPATIASIGYHASAVYPIWGLVIYAWALALLFWSFILTFIIIRPSNATRAFATGTGVVVIAALTTIAVRNDPGDCKRRYEGYGQTLSRPFLRLINLSRADLSEDSYENANFSCGIMGQSTSAGHPTRVL